MTSAKDARVLVVDDEENIRELLSVSLKFQGYDVVTAANGPGHSTSVAPTAPTCWCST